MAQIWRHCRAVAVALTSLAGALFTPAMAEDQGPNAGTDLYDPPVLVVDPGMHTAKLWSQAVDAAGHFAVTGSDDRTVRVWSVADGKLLRTIWIPAGPEFVGPSPLWRSARTGRRRGRRLHRDAAQRTSDLPIRPRVRKPDSANS